MYINKLYQCTLLYSKEKLLKEKLFLLLWYQCFENKTFSCLCAKMNIEFHTESIHYIGSLISILNKFKRMFFLLVTRTRFWWMCTCVCIPRAAPQLVWWMIMVINIIFYIYHIVNYLLERGGDDNATLKRTRCRIEGISRQCTLGNLCIFHYVAAHLGYASKLLGTVTR